MGDPFLRSKPIPSELPSSDQPQPHHQGTSYGKTIIIIIILLLLIIIEINAHYYLHPYFNIYMHQIIKGLWRRSYPRKDSCGIGTHKVEIQPTINLVEYGGL